MSNEELTFDAKMVAGAWFGLMDPGKGQLTFSLAELRPTDRALDALSELVAAHLLSVEPFNRYGGLVYRPLTNFRWAFKLLVEHDGDPAIKWPLTERLSGGEKEARAVQKRALGLANKDHPND